MAATTQIDGSHDDSGKRRSSRHVKKAPVYIQKDDDATVSHIALSVGAAR